MHGEHDVLCDCQPGERAHILERPCHPEPGDLVGMQTGDVPAVQRDLAAVGADRAGKQVEDRRLPGAVRAH